MADFHGRRQQDVRARLAGEQVDGLVITHVPNIRYLTGFTGSAGVLLLLPLETVLVTDFRYQAQAPPEVGNAARVDVATDTWARVGELVQRARCRGLGIEGEAMTVATAERLTQAVGGGAVRPTRGIVEALRACKDPAEVEAIRQAAALGQEAFAAAVGSVRPGRTERLVASVLEGELRRAGSEWHPFPTIVASGPRSALPHARTGDRVIADGDLVLVDFGVQLDGYCADLTRTVVAGRADDRQRAMYDLVREAHAQALAGLRAGLTGREGDALARTVIEARGFGDAFGHSLGHGLGLEVHEAPRLGRTNDEPLPADAVVTVEPGVYFPGWGGIRLEDDVHLTPTGARLLSDGRIELRELT